MRRSYAIVEKAPYLSSCGDPSWDAVMIEFRDSSDGLPFAICAYPVDIDLKGL